MQYTGNEHEQPNVLGFISRLPRKQFESNWLHVENTAHVFSCAVTCASLPHFALLDLNPQQRAAVSHNNGALLVLAGAGSGKTRVVIERAAWLVDQGAHPNQLLAVTFTNKAVGEMRARMFARGLAGAHVSTFHSWGLQILRQWQQHLRPEGNGSLQIYDQEDGEKVLKALLAKRGDRLTPQELREVREWISRAKNRLLTPEEAGESADSKERQWAILYDEYQVQLRRCGAIDLDDLLFETVQLWRSSPDILKSCQERWRYLLIDEYQDTNRAQYEMVRILAGRGHRLTAVGDPDQAIYSWRGADISNILRFETDFPGARVLRLEQNYRSTDCILQASQGLIRHNAQRLDKALWSAKGLGEKIFTLVAEKDLFEARFVAWEIDRLRNEGVPLSQIAVFYRTHAQSRLFEDVLLKKRIPYRIYGGISFYQRREIKDVLAFLRLAQSESDAISFLRAISSPKRGLGKATLDAILAAAERENLTPLDVCRQLLNSSSQNPFQVKLGSKQRDELGKFTRLIEDLKGANGTLTVAQLVVMAVEKSGYLDWLRDREDAFEERKENLDALIAKALQWQEECEEGTSSGTLVDFLEEITLNANAGEQAEEESGAVFLMTLHNSKGLEFEVVFLTGLEEDLFPHARGSNSAAEMEEERRLCYVGMTRAKSRLYLSRVQFRLLWGNWRFMLPSRFLGEISSEHLTRVKLPAF